MAIAFVAASAVVTGASPTVAIPAGYAEGNLLMIVAIGANGTPSTPTGWTQRYAQGSGRFLTILTKYAASSEASVSLSGMGSGATSVMVCYSGAGSYDVLSTIATGLGTTATTNTQVTTYANDYVISIFARAASGVSTFTTPAGTTSRVNSASTASSSGILIADELQASAGTTTARSTTLSASGDWAAINISFVETRTLYWVGGAGTWDTTTTGDWANTSGGTPGTIKPPVQNENVIIDSSSGTGLITISNAVCNNLTVTASQAIILGANTNSLNIYGNLSFPSGGSFSANTNTWNILFQSTSTGKTITTNGKTISKFFFEGVGGGWTLQDALTISTINFTRGTFNANNFNITASSITGTGTSARTITMGSGTWTLTSNSNVWDFTTTTNLTLNADTSTIALSNLSTTNKTFNGGGLTYNNLSITGATGITAYIFTGANTFNQISSSKTVAYTITLPSSTTTTVTTWGPTGSLGNLLTLNSSTAGTAATLAATNAFTVNYGTIRDVNMSATLKGTATNSTLINSNNWQVATTSNRWLSPLTTGTSVTTPSDWPTTAVSNIHVIGGGGGGAGNVTTTIAGGAGGGGGGYALVANTTLAASTLYGYAIGAGGTGSAGGTTTQTGGTGGTSSFSTVNPISFVSSAASVQNTAATTISVTIPSVTDGNLMIMIAQAGGNVTWTTPAGWTLAAPIGDGIAQFYKIASSEPASYTVTRNTSGTSNAFVIVYSNATFDVSSGVSGAGSPVSPDPITVAKPNSTIVYFVGSNSASITFTTPTGYTARLANSDATAPSGALFDLANRTSGSYSAPSTTASSSSGRALAIALSPTETPIASATGGGGGVSTATPTSTGGAGGVGSGVAPAYVSSALTVQTTASTTITVTIPSVSNGNLMIMICQAEGATATFTTPSGWTIGTAASEGRALFWKVASSEPASYTVTTGSSVRSQAFVSAYSNASFDTSGLANQTNANPVQPVAITVAKSYSTILYVTYRDADSTTFSTPLGYTARQADSDNRAPSGALFDITTGVAAGSYTAPTSTGSSGGKGFVIALSPSTGGYTGGAGGAGGTSGTVARTGGGGGGAAGPNGNGGNGGAGVNSSGTATNAGSGSGGGNGGGTAGGAGTATIPNGAGGNNSLGTGGGAAVTTITTAGNPGTLGGGGSGNVGTGASGTGGVGGNGIDIISVLSAGSGGGGGGSSNSSAAGAGGLYGGGGGGNGRAGAGTGAGGAGAQGAIFVGYTGTYVAPISTGNFFFLFM